MRNAQRMMLHSRLNFVKSNLLHLHGKICPDNTTRDRNERYTKDCGLQLLNRRVDAHFAMLARGHDRAVAGPLYSACKGTYCAKSAVFVALVI